MSAQSTKADWQTASQTSPDHRSGIDWRQLGIISVFLAASLGLVSFVLLWQFDDNVLSHQQAGEVALADWLAPKTQSYQSAVKTRQLGDAAASRVSNLEYKRDTALVSRERDRLEALLRRLTTARSMGTDVATLAADPVVNAAGLENSQLLAILNLPDGPWDQVSQEARTTFSIEMNRDILPDGEFSAQNSLRDSVYTPYTISDTFARLDQAARNLTVALIKSNIKANNVIDEAATQKKRDAARAEVGPATVDIIKGTALIRRGDVLTPLQIEELQELGLHNFSYNWGLVAGTVGLVAILLVLLVYYCVTLTPQIWTTLRWPVFLTLCLTVAALAMRVLVVGADKDSTRPYLLPLAAVSMVIAALFDVNLALFLATLLALLTGLSDSSPHLIMVFFAGGVAGALVIRKAEHTSVFAWAGIAVAICQFAVAACATLLNQNLDAFNLGMLLLYSILNGLISASLAFFCFSVLGKLFGVATVLQLLELAHPNQPLLRRLIREAPGTYHHSILVSNLAEQAAERVADNALLARVGAYYHDIGKLSRPSYYIDNQAGGNNIHDELDPRESARLICSHVSDGVALARKHKLPRKVIDIIHQHHGTCMISFFYQKALKEGLDVYEIDFRYPGPKPQTKVAAIVMLADGCEAAVRANVQSGRILTGRTSSIPATLVADSPATKTLTIREVVDKIIDDRIKDNQLNECDLTLRDIAEIRNLYVEILTGIYHPRLIYPDKDSQSATVKTASAENHLVTTEAREVPVALARVPVEAMPVSVTAGAADSGGKSVTEPTERLNPTREDGQRPGPTFSLKGDKPRIGGAGRKLDKSEKDDTRL